MIINGRSTPLDTEDWSESFDLVFLQQRSSEVLAGYSQSLLWSSCDLVLVCKVCVWRLSLYKFSPAVCFIFILVQPHRPAPSPATGFFSPSSQKLTSKTTEHVFTAAPWPWSGRISSIRLATPRVRGLCAWSSCRRCKVDLAACRDVSVSSCCSDRMYSSLCPAIFILIFLVSAWKHSKQDYKEPPLFWCPL